MISGQSRHGESPRILLEICTGSVSDAMGAARQGADRIELNTALETGGLTPSPGMVETLVRRIDIPVIIMLRPLTGGFAYDDVHFQSMLRDAEWIVSSGAAGVALGILDSEGRLDIRRCRRLIRKMDGLEIVFHRAFDEIMDPFEALEGLIDLGVHRILTSGQAKSAPRGSGIIMKLITKSQGRLEILPGGGIRPDNVLPFIQETGVRQVHASLSNWKLPAGTFPVSARRPGNSGNPWHRYLATDLEEVRIMRRVLDQAADGLPFHG